MPEDRHVRQRGVDLPDAAHGDRPDRRPGQPAGDAGRAPAACVSVSMTMPSRVLIIDRPSAPASTQARAIVDDVGHVRRELGEAPGRRRRRLLGVPPRPPRPRPAGSQAKTRPRSSTFGQEMLTSTPTSPGAPRSRWASSAYSSTVPPAIDTTARAPSLAQPGQVVLEERVDARALQADRVEHAARRLGHPRRGPPGPRLQHDRLGDDGAELGDVEELVELAAGGGTAGRGHHRVRQHQVGRAARSCRRSGRRGRGASTVRTWKLISALRRAPRRCRPGRCRRRPSAPGRRGTPGPRRRSAPSGCTPSSPTTGSTQVMQTPMPQAIDSSTAHWPTTPRGGGDLGDRAQHRHRPAARRRRRCRAASITPGSTSVTRPRMPGRAVVGGDRDRRGHPLRLEHPEQPVLARRAEHDVDPAAPGAQRVGQPEQRGAAVAAADQRRRRPARAAA